jgi:HTH-type transcriptional regulator/antitoxin HigA
VSTKRTATKEADRYFELVRRFPLRPIRSDEELDRAVAMVDVLIDRFDRLDQDERDYLNVLSDLVRAYEDETVPIKPGTDAEMLAFLLEVKQVTQADLAKQTGIVESTISEVLSGKRKLNRTHISKLCKFFQVGPGVFQFG